MSRCETARPVPPKSPARDLPSAPSDEFRWPRKRRKGGRSFGLTLPLSRAPAPVAFRSCLDMNESTPETKADTPAALATEGSASPLEAGPAVDPAALPAGEPVLEPPAPLAPEPPLVSPDVPRMAPPAYTAKTVADPTSDRPSRLFLFIVASVSLFGDIASKLWAEKALDGYPGFVSVSDEHLMFILAKNKGGAWGLLQGQNENVRRPFFLLVSVAAIAFIMTLYRRLSPRQHALRWGLPLVLGGALGNVFDRIRYGHVIDFIDYRAEWVRKMNALIAKYLAPDHYVTDHWPTFNVADIAICVGVGLMAVDMFTSRRGKPTPPQHEVSAPAGEPSLAASVVPEGEPDASPGSPGAAPPGIAGAASPGPVDAASSPDAEAAKESA